MLTLPWSGRVARRSSRERAKARRGGVNGDEVRASGKFVVTPSRSLSLATSPLQGEVKMGCLVGTVGLEHRRNPFTIASLAQHGGLD